MIEAIGADSVLDAVQAPVTVEPPRLATILCMPAFCVPVAAEPC